MERNELIQKWRKALAEARGDNNVIMTIYEFLADLGDPEAIAWLGGFKPKKPKKVVEEWDPVTETWIKSDSE